MSAPADPPVDPADPLVDPPFASPRRRLGVGAAIAVALVALAATIGAGVVRTATAPVEEVVSQEAAPTSTAGGAGAAPGTAYVHVLGAVARPGLFVVHEGARVVDAIAAAGGFLPEADRSAVNLARPVSDGEQLIVPVVGAEGTTTLAPSTGGTSGGAASDGRVNLNTADEAALDTLPRIGPAMAARIIQWREDNGRFTSVDDLLAVPGIGAKMLESLRDLVTV